MTPDPFRERDLAAAEIVATVRTDGVRAVVELSVDDLDRLTASGVTVHKELCNICWTADAQICHPCACDVGTDIVEALTVEPA